MINVSKDSHLFISELEEAMASIKASCPTCGVIEMTEHDVRLMACNNAALSYYAFDCVLCGEIRKPTDDHIVSLLMSVGVKPMVWSIPAEALEAKSGPPLSYDDLLEFALQLGDSDHLAALALRSAA